MFAPLHALLFSIILLSVLASDNLHAEHNSFFRRAHRRSLSSASVSPPLPTPSHFHLPEQNNHSTPADSGSALHKSTNVSTSPNSDATNSTAPQSSLPTNVTTNPANPGPPTLDDFQLIAERRIVNIINALGNSSGIAAWSVYRFRSMNIEF